MPDSLVGVLVAIALVLPGFVVVQLSRVQRATADESELELVLRALFYALLIHVAFSWWTADVVDAVPAPDEWTEHLSVLVPYTLVVLVLTPLVVGSALGAYLRYVESHGKTGLLYSILGAHDARDAFDYLFQRLDEGAWLIIELTDDTYVGGKYGRHSSVGQSPAEHNIYLQEVWLAEADPIPVLVGKIEPQRGLLLAPESIRAIHVVDPPGS